MPQAHVVSAVAYEIPSVGVSSNDEIMGILMTDSKTLEYGKFLNKIVLPCFQGVYLLSVWLFC